MPFDYNSFLQGVQTGLRLGRTSPGRKPPVPSGRYILTESGDHILTEIQSPDDDVLYSTGVWYDTIYHVWYGYQNRRRFRWSGDKELQIFAFQFDGIPRQRWVMFISETPLVDTTFYFDREYEVYNTSTGQREIWTSTDTYVVYSGYSPDRAGDYYVYYAYFLTSAPGDNIDYPDFVYKVFPGSYVAPIAVVCNYVATFKSKRTITEGG